MNKPLNRYFARQLSDKLTLPEMPNRVLAKIVNLLDHDGRVLVKTIHDEVYPGITAAAANRALNRLISDVNSQAEKQGLSLRMEISQNKKGGASSRHVWFTGPIEAPAGALLTDLAGVNAGTMVTDQRATFIDDNPVIVLITYNEHETRAVRHHFSSTGSPETVIRDGVNYHLLDIIQGVRIVHRISSQGEVNSAVTTMKAFSAWNPRAIIGVGIAFGANKNRQEIGDVLVSEYVVGYDLGRENPDGTYQIRGGRPFASYYLVQRYREWKHTHQGKITLPRTELGGILSGSRLIDNIDYRDTLIRQVSAEICGGEMEAVGLYTVAEQEGFDWLIVKAICDWADGNKNNPDKEKDQKLAAENAAQVLRALLEYGPLYESFSTRSSPHTPAPRFIHREKDACDALIKDTQGINLSLKKDSTLTTHVGIDVLTALTTWAKDAHSTQLFALLGEYGMGKTITCQRLAQQITEERHKNPSLPIPLIFDLRDVQIHNGNVPTLTEVVLECMKRGWAADTEYTLDMFWAWIDAGALVIFDGLDEVLVKLSENEGAQLTRGLLTLVDTARMRPSGAKPKILMSCRTQYYRTLNEQRNHLTLEERGNKGAENFTGLQLLPFNEAQIQRYLELVSGKHDTATLMNMLQQVHDLKDLAGRPVALKMISESIATLEEQRRQGETINTVSLYRLIVQRWLDRDSGKHSFKPEHKIILAENLAAHLWRTGKRNLPAEDIENWLHEWIEGQIGFSRYSRFSPAQLEEDLRVATFLSRRDEGENSTFEFAHTSFQEYFLASYLHRAITKDRPDLWQMPVPSSETFNFLADLIGDNTEQLSRISRWLCEDSKTDKHAMLEYCLHCHQTGRFTPSLVGAVLSDLNLSESTFDGYRRSLDLSNSTFRRCDLRRSQFGHVNLNSASFDNSIMTQASFLECNLELVRFSTVDTSHIRFKPQYLEQRESMSLVARGLNSTQVDLAPQLVPSSPQTSLSFSSAFPILATGGSDGAVRIWDPSSNHCIMILNANHGWINDIALTGNGERLATAGTDGLVRIWDSRSGDCLQAFKAHSGYIDSIAFDRFGERIVSAGEDMCIRIWNTLSAERLSTLRGHSGWIHSATFDPSGERVASASSDDTVRIWDIHSSQCLQVLNGHKSSVRSVIFSPCGKRLASASDDMTIRIWNSFTGESQLLLKGHTGWVQSVAFSPTGKWLASAGDDMSIRIWDSITGECLRVLKGHTSWIQSVAFLTDDSQIATTGWDGDVRIWDLESGACSSRLSGYTSPLRTSRLNSSSTRLACSGNDGVVHLWSYLSGQHLLSLNGRTGAISSIAFDPLDERLASASIDGSAHIWDLKTAQCSHILPVQSGRLRAIAFDSSGEYVATAGDDMLVRLWSTSDGKCIGTLEGHTGSVRSIVFTTPGNALISASTDGTLRLWNILTQQCSHTFSLQGRRLTSVAFDPNNASVAMGSDDGRIFIYNLASLKLTQVLIGHEGPVSDVAFHLTGDSLVSAGDDATVRVWDMTSGKCVQTMRGHVGEVSSITFDSRNERVVSAGQDGTVRIWDPKTTDLIRIQAVIEPGPFGIGGYATWDPRNKHLIEWAGEAWRSLSWRYEDGRGVQILPLEAIQPEKERKISPSEWAVPLVEE